MRRNSVCYLVFERAVMTPAASVLYNGTHHKGGEAMDTTGEGDGAQQRTDGIRRYYLSKIDELEMIVNDKTKNLARLEAQRNQLNSKVRLLREELSLLQEQGSHVGEVVKAMDKKKVLVKGY